MPERDIATRSSVLDDQEIRVSDLPDEVSQVPELQSLAEVPVPSALKDQVEDDLLDHRDFTEGPFWKRLPVYQEVSEQEFLDYRFQQKHSITSFEQLADILEGVASDGFIRDVEEGLRQAPMSLRLSPYLLSLIDWNTPYRDPIRIQFIPVASTHLEDHPMLSLDSLHEQEDSPTPGLVHRYPDKALFLPLDVCPVYCRFCTRSYAIGGDTGLVKKLQFRPNPRKWESAFAYLASRPEVEDVVVSGGDTYLLPPARLRQIGETLLAIPHIRRIRLASKGPAVMPMKILSHQEWTQALVDIVELGRQQCKEVCLHTHFNSTHEITSITQDAMNLLFEQGVTVRNQSVLVRGVNDDPKEMVRLVRQLSYMNVQPYYVYQHDMVKGVEELRTRVADTVEIERHVRGSTAGFNTPTFVNDVPGGGGKRDVHSYDYYDETTGVSVYRSPSVDEEAVYLYFDPIHLLPPEGRARWGNLQEHSQMVSEVLQAAECDHLQLARG